MKLKSKLIHEQFLIFFNARYFLLWSVDLSLISVTIIKRVQILLKLRYNWLPCKLFTTEKYCFHIWKRKMYNKCSINIKIILASQSEPIPNDICHVEDHIEILNFIRQLMKFIHFFSLFFCYKTKHTYSYNRTTCLTEMMRLNMSKIIQNSNLSQKLSTKNWQYQTICHVWLNFGKINKTFIILCIILLDLGI
jgi:hypothetical protein